jgi:hypothetical protein
MDGGMTETEVQTLFPELDFSGNMEPLASLADFASQRSGELEGLSTILNGLIPEEMQKLAVDLDLTEAKKRWEEFAANPGAITPDAVISLKVALTGYDLAAYNEFVQNNPVEVTGSVRLGEAFDNPQDVLSDPNAKFYQDGVEIPVSAVPKEQLDPNTLFIRAADGTVHVLITPEVKGTPESVQAANDLLKSTEHQGSLGSKLFGEDTLTDMQRLTEYLTKIKTEIDSPLNIGDIFTGWNKEAASGTISSYLDATEIGNIQATVSEAMKSLNNGETLSEEMITNLQSISNLVNLMDTIGVGENILAGIATGMTEAGTDTTADTVATNLETALNKALEIESPSKKVKPVGDQVAAGVGAGMTEHDMSTDAATLATNVETAIGKALNGSGEDSDSSSETSSPLATLGTNAAGVLADAMAAYDMTAMGKSVATSAETALSEKLKKTTLKPVGLNAMTGLKDGIVAGTADVVAAMKAAANAAVKAAKDELKIKSPSGVLRDEVGRMSMRGFGQGVLLETKAQAKTIRNAARFLTGEAKSGAVAYAPSDNRRTYNQQSTVQLSGNTFYVRDEQDIRSLATEIASLTKRQQRGRGLRTA